MDLTDLTADSLKTKNLTVDWSAGFDIRSAVRVLGFKGLGPLDPGN